MFVSHVLQRKRLLLVPAEQREWQDFRPALAVPQQRTVLDRSDGFWASIRYVP